jgi:DNA repair exonuclease SbcCD ATPase subunit
MNFLKKVILVNSWPSGSGKFRVFDVDGGAILQGGNGVGKTSTLILPLLFFGARPSDVMRASKKKSDKFVNRYLPTDSSYIAFEYVKDNQSKLVIVHSPDGENLYYLFCDAEFSDKLFLDEHNRFVKVENLRNHLQVNNGVPVYKKRFGVMQYRDIIQSAKRLPLSQNDARTINEAKQRFSLCENNESIAGSEKVAVSIISSSPSFQSIKELIAQEVEIFDGGVQDQLSKETNVKELQQQATIIRQTKGFLSHQDKVKDLSVLSRTINGLENELGQLKHQALKRYEEQESLQSKADAKKEKRANEFTSYESEYNERNREYNKIISQLKGDVSDAQSRVTKLKKEFQAYQESGIEDKRRQGEQVNQLDNEVQLLEKQLESLKGAFEKIDRLYQQQIDALEKSFNERISAEKDRLASDKDKEEAIRQGIQAKQQNELDALATSYQENRQRITIEQTKIEVELGKLDQIITSPSSPELQRLTDYARQLHRALTDKQKAQVQSQESLSGIKEQRSANQAKIDKNKGKQERYKLHIKKLTGEIEDCKKSLRHVDSMLFFKLANLSPQKANIASRALTLDLLKTPVKEELVIDTDDNSLLGFELDMSHLPPQQVLDREELERELSNLEQVEQRTRDSLAELSQERIELDQQANELYQHFSNAEVALGQFKLEVEQLESRFEKAETDVKTESRKIKEQAKQSKREQQALLEELETQDKALLGNYESDKDKVKQSANEALNESFERIKAKQSSLRQYEEKQREELNQKVAALEAHKRKDLTEQGAQTEAIESCETSISEQSGKLQAAKDAQAEYERYSAWLDGEYIYLPKWESRLDESQKDLDKTEREQQELTLNFNTTLNEHNTKLKELNKVLQTASHEVITLRQLLDGYLSSVPAKENDGIPPSADRLQRQVKSIHNEIEEHDKQGKHLFMRVMTGFRQYDELYKLCRDLLLQEGLDELDTGKNWKVLAVSLSHLMGGTLVEQIDTIKQVFATKSKELVSLDEKLTETEKRILLKGREISRQFNNSGTSFENIYALEVDIKTSLSRLPFRKSLAKAASAFNEAKILAAHESPTDAYFDVIATAVRDIAEQKSGLDVSSFVEVVVRAKNSEYEPWREAVTNEELEGISSEGLSLLILISLYAAIKNVIQKNHSAVLLWSVDEIGKLHSDNTSELKAILEKERIQIFGATPEANLKVVEAFNHFYDLRSKGKIHKFDDTKRLLAKDAIFGNVQPVPGEAHA